MVAQLPISRTAIIITTVLALAFLGPGAALATPASTPTADPQVNPDGHCDGPKLAPGLPEANDLDNDGYYEDVDGDFDTDIFDVQMFFQGAKDPCEPNKELFNFDFITPVTLTQSDAYSLYVRYVWSGF